MASTTPPSSAVLALNDAHRQIWEELAPHLIECTPDAWLTQYVRKIGEQSLDNVASNDFVKHVMKNLQNSLTQAGWVGLLTPQKGDKVDDVYSSLVNIFNDICRVALQLDSSLEQSTILESTGSTISASEVRSYQPKPDFQSYPPDRLKFKRLRVANPGRARRGDAVRAEAKVRKAVQSLQEGDGPATRRNTSDTVAIGEVKLKHDLANEEDDEVKLIGNATEVMYNDPCRRFIFGFAIQKDQMRLWHFNRSHTCRSQRFNIHEKTGRWYLIAFLLLLGFAKHHELGFDPTVTRVEVQSESGPPVIAYRYDVENQDSANRKSYLTEGPPISESAAYHLCSRATRVWKVRQIMSITDDGEITLSDAYHVLKDVWLYSDSRGEKAIQDDIFERLGAADKMYGTDHRSEARHYFVTILNDWKVAIDGRRDETPGLPSFGPVAPGSLPAVTSSDDSKILSTTPQIISVKHKHRARQHYRTMYKEVCKSISDIEDYEIALQVLIGNLLALHYLFIAGYVHRDVSAGNCLWYPENKVGKLSDLEYARPYAEVSGHDPRTGTPAFMAAEYLTGIELFAVWDDVDPADYVKPKPKQSILRKDRTQKRLRPVVSQPSGAIKEVKFNFYHDVESAFWIYLWYLVHHFPNALSQGRNNFEALPKTVKLFNGDNILRQSLFTSATMANDVQSALSVAYTAPFDVLVDVRPS